MAVIGQRYTIKNTKKIVSNFLNNVILHSCTKGKDNKILHFSNCSVAVAETDKSIYVKIKLFYKKTFLT